MNFGEAVFIVPKLDETSSLRLVVLYYREPSDGKESVFPPHQMVIVDPRSKEVVESKPCTPREFGVDQEAGQPIEGFGLRVTVNEFWDRKIRLKEISPTIWDLYAEGNTQLEPEARDLVREYFTCYQRIAKAPLIPYYEAIGEDFFRWIEKVLA